VSSGNRWGTIIQSDIRWRRAEVEVPRTRIAAIIFVIRE
jgi:hypothetical protein